MQIWDLPSNEADAVTFSQEHCVLPKRRVCGSGCKAKLYFGKLISWKCNIKSCQNKVKMGVDNWLVVSHISFVSALPFIYYWAVELTSLN